jgi:transcriptional regulator with XRE-family HTH domain
MCDNVPIVFLMERHDDLTPFAKVIRTFRQAGGYTQEGFAHESHLDRGFVGAVERAERNVGFRKIRQLLIGLGIDWSDFGVALQEIDPLPKRGSSRRRSSGSR